MEYKATKVSRRNFFQLAAAAGLATGVVSLAGCAPQGQSKTASSAEAASRTSTEESWMEKPDPIDESKITETKEADIVIIGGGLSGVCTASSALENGLSVIVLEKNETPRMTGLDFGCVNPTIAKELGLELSEDDIYKLTREWVHMAANRVRPDIILNFVRNSGPALDWLSEKAIAWGCTPKLAAMKSESDTYFNYIRPIEFHDGPLFDIEGGAYGVNDIITMLTEEIKEQGGQYLIKTTAEQLEKDGERVSAVVAKTNDGEYVRYSANKAVVLCSGDFGANTEMVADLTDFNLSSYDDPAGFVNVSVESGDGHRMGLWAGASMQMGPQPTMMLPMTYPYFYLRVNDRGERHCNEDCDSVNMCINQLQQHRGNTWAIWDAKWPEEIPASLEVSGGMSWDQDFRVYGDSWSKEAEEAFLQSEIEMGNLTVADTLEELADQTGISSEGLKSTIAHYNELVESGTDSDFGKRSELMTPISEPPFYALHMQTMLCVSVGGLNVNTHSQALDETGAPIKGLYAVGNTAAGLFGVDYNEAPIPGISLGRCVTFGKMLGDHLATV